MFWDSCNRHASSVGAGWNAFGAFLAQIRRRAERAPRKKAQFVRRFSGVFLAVVLPFAGDLLAAPARAEAPARFDVDALLPAGDESDGGPKEWRLFRLGAQRFARVPAESSAWAGEAWTRAEWKTLPSPGGAFRPVQAVQAARGYFLLVDAASSRLCLYDTSAGLISTFPLPERFTPFSAGRAAVFRGADGTFIFADYASGEAWQYADREGLQGRGGAAAWVLRARVKMPMGWRDCYQQPGSEGLACKAASGALYFDGALNRAKPSKTGADPTESRLDWDPEAREWVLTGEASAGAAPLFRYRPESRTLVSP